MSEWIIGGKIYLDYITINDIVNDMMKVSHSITKKKNLDVNKFYSKILLFFNKLSLKFSK